MNGFISFRAFSCRLVEGVQSDLNAWCAKGSFLKSRSQRSRPAQDDGPERSVRVGPAGGADAEEVRRLGFFDDLGEELADRQARMTIHRVAVLVHVQLGLDHENLLGPDLRRPVAPEAAGLPRRRPVPDIG